MKIAVGAGHLHLTYCLNIHAGETWAQHLQTIRFDQQLLLNE